MSNLFLHQLPDAKELFEAVANERNNLLPQIIEKDYWLMHCLWGLQKQGYQFELKGGTSLSRGFQIIDRFSEDIDIQIYPNERENIPTGKNQDKKKHIQARAEFFDKMTKEFNIPGLTFERDHAFDDEKLRSAGIRGRYNSQFGFTAGNDEALKPGILLELGFDQTTPNTKCTITSWTWDKVDSMGVDVINNRARNVLCYNPEYILVEKLQTISTKYRRYQQSKSMPVNFLRHYYDVYKLLDTKRIQEFIGTELYFEHKDKRFRASDEKDISTNSAFNITDKATQAVFVAEFSKKSALYFGKQPSLDEILKCIRKVAALL